MSLFIGRFNIRQRANGYAVYSGANLAKGGFTSQDDAVAFAQGYTREPRHAPVTTPKASHTPGLLRVGAHNHVSTTWIIGDRDTVAQCPVPSRLQWSESVKEAEANAARLVACWNALEGIAEPEAVRKFMESLARQKTSAELDPLDAMDADYEAAYDGIITDCREALYLARLAKGGE